MLTAEEEKFVNYWRENRDKPRTGLRQFRVGLSIGIVLGIGIIVNLTSGWYSRANMVANSQSTPIVLLIAIFGIAIFCSVFYRQFRREANEQRFLELIAKKEKQNAVAGVQQDEEKSSPIENP